MTALVSSLGNTDAGNVSGLPKFSGQELFHIIDVFSQAYLEHVIDHKGRPGAIISCSVLSMHEDHGLGLPFFGLPLWAMGECRLWSQADFDGDLLLITDHVFNFMVNKKQCSRYILIKLVEIGNYRSFQYTWSGTGRQFDMSQVIIEMDNLAPGHPAGSSDFKSRMLAPIDLPTRFIGKTGVLDDEASKKLANGAGHIKHGNIKSTWHGFLKDMFSRSCISLISETGGFDRLAVMSEKTLFAIFGLTFPIWIGNYGEPHSVENLGLDVFNDLIDHSYQWYPTLIERCYWAFELNKTMLNDLAYCRDLRQRHLDRLLANRKFLLEDGLTHYCQKQISNMPPQYQAAAEIVKTKFDRSQSDSR